MTVRGKHVMGEKNKEKIRNFQDQTKINVLKQSPASENSYIKANKLENGWLFKLVTKKGEGLNGKDHSSLVELPFCCEGRSSLRTKTILLAQ